MDALPTIFFAVLAIGFAAWLYILIAKPVAGSAVFAAMVSAGFGAFTAIQIWSEGIVMFYTNAIANMTGAQVWWDLVMCVIVAFFFIAPRARKQNMNVLPWGLFAACTGSVGLLAMCARLFWLENASSDVKSALSHTGL